MHRGTLITLSLFLAGTASIQVAAQEKKQVIPHAQTAPPGPPLTPQQAIAKMVVPAGFSVELVAAEPDLVNPVAMAFDEKGRIWVAESIEYPRMSAGPGKDRIKVLEDTDLDGKVDKTTVVITGLNIPSGIAVGHGGVWVANAPDILFFPFEDFAALKLGKPEVVVTGFGRADTHELPNSLTWGPDGRLYGLNGVYNPSLVTQDGRTWKFTCAMFHIDPRTRKFGVFCEGTSNPWGIAFNEHGDAFVSACVIDHLWHLTETGYYHRQGGAYPPFTWKLPSIVNYKHQKAAYCGIHYFDSDAYPAEYRGKLYMGNIHGGCINVDELSRDGATYQGKPCPDFLAANDAWFMPVVQKTGPDGCLYILDWYDRYHCYQDARRDAAGIDRLHGRLYRVRYKDTPRAKAFDLTQESDEQLMARLGSPNVFFRDLAQRVLAERGQRKTKLLGWQLEDLAIDRKATRATRLHALWACMGVDRYHHNFVKHLLNDEDATFRAWGVRAALRLGDFRPGDLFDLARDKAPEVKLQVAIAARRVDEGFAMDTLMEVLAHSGNDTLIPHIVWQNLHPLLETRSRRFVDRMAELELPAGSKASEILPRAIDRLVALKPFPADSLVKLVLRLAEKPVGHGACAQCLALLAAKVESGEVAGANLDELQAQIQPALRKLPQDGSPLAVEAMLLGAALRDELGIKAARQHFADPQKPVAVRVKALSALIAANDPQVLEAAQKVLADRAETAEFRGKVLATLGKVDSPKVGEVVLERYAAMEPELKPSAIELLTERASWSRQLLAAIRSKKLASNALNVNQVRKLLASRDVELVKQVQEVWGAIREGRNPEREKVVIEIRDLITKTPGDARAGVAVFKKLCAQCHKMHGEGFDVGPDLTGNGRADFDQLLSNVLDPSLVIGVGYRATMVTTVKGQVLTGLLVEDSPQRVVLKAPGGKLEIIARADVDTVDVSRLSMMPEALERQLQPQEVVDLFAFLCLDRHPDDPQARKIPGTPR